MMNKLLKIDVASILLAIILNANVFRFYMGERSDIVMYLVYIFCFLFLLKKHYRELILFVKQHRDFQLLYLSTFLLLVYSLISCSWNYSIEVIFQFCKFLLTFLIFFFIPVLNRQLVLRVLLFSLFINIVYCGNFLLDSDLVAVYLGSGANYLNATLTIGLSFVLSLVIFVYSFINGKIILLLVSLLCNILFVMGLLLFTARGVLLFPPIIALVLLFVMGKKRKFRSFVLIGLFVGVSLYITSVFLSNDSEIAVSSRMVRLFEDTEDESRIGIWKDCLDVMFKDGWFILGGGVDAFKLYIGAYPHNIFIQAIGEHGFIGILWIFYFLLVSYRAIKNIILFGDNNDLLSYIVLGAFLYYLLNFSKSFQLYEILPLLICFSFLIITSGKYPPRYCYRRFVISNKK